MSSAEPVQDYHCVGLLRRLRNPEEFSQGIQDAMYHTFGHDDAAEDEQDGVPRQDEALDPSERSFRRCRLRLDCTVCLLKRRQWDHWATNSSAHPCYPKPTTSM